MNTFFIKFRNIWFAFSAFLIAWGVVAVLSNYKSTGHFFNMGIDFTGGVAIMVSGPQIEEDFAKLGKISDATNAEFSSKLRESLQKQGIKEVQLTTVDDRFFQLKISKTDALEKITRQLKADIEGLQLIETSFVGPTIGEELVTQSWAIIFAAVVLLLIYITFRFELKFGVAAIIALIHDALVTVGLSAFLGIEINTAFIAAILTILGYSINDTIVIFDRIRENLKNVRAEDPAETIEKGITQSLTRCITTTLTTLIMLLAVYFFGGASIKEFALVLFIGISIGSYSSIFIATPILYLLRK